jgi:hypothetical protein
MKKYFLYIVLTFGIYVFGFSQESNTTLLKLDFPIFDLPYQIDIMNTMGYGFFNSYTSPSMAQSLAISVNIFSAFHYGMSKFYDSSRMNLILRNIIFYGGTIFGDVLLGALPPFKFITFLHEEYHKSNYSKFGVYSFNNTYTFNDIIGGSMINMKDDDLKRFKEESSTDFVRQHAAGFEGENLLLDTLQKIKFFYGKESTFFTEFAFVPHYWIELIAMHIYLTNPSDPDGVGTDSPSWIYNLFRPNEPHNVKFINSLGIETYRNPVVEDFTDKELNYFKKVGYWQIVSYISPMMFGFRSLPLGNTDIRWNFSFRHFLTSFGTDITFKVFLNINKYNFVSTYHNYMNYDHIFPTIEIQMVDYPVKIDNFQMLLSPRIMIGIQPKGQEFFTSEAEFFGLIATRADFQINKHLFPYFEITAKTNGWVAGNEYLEKNAKFVLGMSTRFY